MFDNVLFFSVCMFLSPFICEVWLIECAKSSFRINRSNSPRNSLSWMNSITDEFNYWILKRICAFAVRLSSLISKRPLLDRFRGEMTEYSVLLWGRRIVMCKWNKEMNVERGFLKISG